MALLRPKQWVKNVFVLAPLLFGEQATDPDAILTALAAVAVFSVLASGVYALNDAYDVEEDRAHPHKRLRPIASGRIPVARGAAVGAALVALAMAGAWALQVAFGVIAVAYVAVNAAYTLVLKGVVILDVFVVASFFLMRLLAGAFVVSVEPSVWLLLCGGLLALYLGFAKRRNELLLLRDESPRHRLVLSQYDAPFLDQMSGVLLSVTIVSYIMFTQTSVTAARVGTELLSYSVVFVLYGVFRYLYLSHREDGGGDVAETVLSDPPLMLSVAVWVGYCAWVIYAVP